jgi:hypothetical protein
MTPESFYVHHIHDIPSAHPILSQLNLSNILKRHFLKIHFNIILLSIPVSPKWFVPVGVSDQNFYTRYLWHVYSTQVLFSIILFNLMRK